MLAPNPSQHLESENSIPGNPLQRFSLPGSRSRSSAATRGPRYPPRKSKPSTAIMRLQDKDWIFRKEGDKRFRRVEVQADGLAPDGMQEIRDGVKSGDEVVANALEFSTAVAEKKD